MTSGQTANESMQEPRRSRRTLWVMVTAGVVCVLALGGRLFLRSSGFQEMVRARLVAALEQSTGARIEWKDFSFYPSRLEISLRGFTLHGREGPQEPPLFSAELIQADWKLTSVWNLRADLSRLRVWNPKIYAAFYEGGGNNLPLPPRKTPGQGSWIERIFALRVGTLEVLRGEFRWNDDRRPFDFRAENILAVLEYQGREDRYAGRLDYQNALLTFGKAAPLVSRARTKFFLYPTRAEIESLEWHTARSALSAQGEIEDFRAPKLQLRYQLQLDMREAGEFLGNPGWQGELLWRGQGGYGDAGWQLEGDLGVTTTRSGVAALREVAWGANSKLRVTGPRTSGTEGKSVPWRAQLEGLEVMALGGRLAGSASVEMVSPSPTTRLELQAERISLPALLKALTPPLQIPLTQLGWVGAISGPVQASFVGTGKNLSVSNDWQVDAPPDVPPGLVPVSGRLQGSYQAARKLLEIRGSYVNLPQTRLSADGWLDDRETHLEIGLDTTRLEESRSLIELAGKKYADVPFRLSDHGRAQARLLWTGGIQQPKFDGGFELTQFSYRNTPWDHFSGTLHYRSDTGSDKTLATFGDPPGDSIGTALRLRPSALLRAGSGQTHFTEVGIDSGRLVKGTAVAQFTGRAGLEEGSFSRRSPFSVEATVRNLNLEDLQNLLGIQFPVRGTLQASGKAFGTADDPRGEATVALADGTVYDESFDRLTARLAVEAPDVLSATQVRLQKGKATLLGNATVNRKTEEYKFSATGSDLPLEEFPFLRSQRWAPAGIAQVTLSGEGTRNRPQVKGKIEVRKLVLPSGASAQEGLQGEEDGRLALDIETRDRRVFLRGGANLFGTEMQVSGEVLSESPFPISARLQFENMDVPRMIRTVRQPPEALSGRAGGVVLVEGEWKQPDKIVIRGDISKLDGVLGAMNFHADRPLRFRYQNSLVQLEPLHLVGPSLDLETTGSIRLAADPALNLTARGRADLSALPVLDPQLTSSGQVSLDGFLNGTLAKPQWRGRLLFSDGALRYGNLPNSFTKIKGTVVFEGNRGLLENFTAESGGGQVQLGGFVTYANPNGWQFQLTADAESVRVRYPPGVSTVLSGRLTWSGTSNESLLAGRLMIRRESVNPQFDLAQVLLSQRNESGAPPRNAFVRNLRLDLHVVSAPDIRLDTSAARNLQGDVDLRMQGTVEHPVWLGRIGILQGELYFAGKKYTVSRGEITFLNPFRIEPILSLSVQARVQQYDISMDFAGPPDRLTLAYRSDPPLPTGDILALLVAGSSRPGVAETPNSQPLPQIGAGSLLSQALTAQIGSRLDRIFGAGRVRVDPQLAGFNRPANASVAIEQQIKDDITITYITNVTSVRQQIIQGEWAISQRFSVTAIRDQNGLVGVNFQMKLRFR